jgi:predicted transcriptional regulator
MPTTDQLPGAEMEVLACLRNKGAATAREVREAMLAYRPMEHGAIITLLKRLEDKGLVAKRKGPVGKAFIFRPVKKAHDTIGRSVQELVRRIFAGDGVALVASLFENRPPTPEEVDRLQKMLDEARKASGPKASSGQR